MNTTRILAVMLMCLVSTHTAYAQYFDAETGLHQNHFRDYDPGSGRYLQSDPIGLAGGLNPYNYANSNPGRYIDPLGLLPPPNNPGEELIRANVGIAHETWNPYVFYDLVKNRGPWDFKRYNSDWEDFGNYNFGLTGAATGLFHLSTLLREAGRVQCRNGTSEPRFGLPTLGPTYGDDPVDQYWAITGWLDYHAGLYGAPRGGSPSFKYAAESFSRYRAPNTCTNACNIWGEGAKERQVWK